MKTLHRLQAITLATVVAAGLLASPVSAQTTGGQTTGGQTTGAQTTGAQTGTQTSRAVETRAESFIATAAARGLNLNVLGTRVTIGQSSAVINSVPSAKASGAGVALVSGTVSNSEVSGVNQTQAPPKACVLNLPVANLIAVQLACGESRASTGADGPQAFGSGSVAGVDLAGLNLLDPVVQLLQQLLNALLPVVDQTVGTVTGLLGPGLGNVLTPLAGNLGLGTGSTVAPVSGLVNQLLDGVKRATKLVDIKVGPSTAQTTTASAAVTATANSAGAQIDILPGLTLGGSPLLSVIVGQAKSTSTFDRTTAKSTPTFDAAVARVRLGLPLLGGVGLDIPIQLGTPLTLLAGTPLETTISLGAGRTVTDPATGSVASYADGVSIQALKGIGAGGIGIDLAHAETGVGGQSRLVTQQQIVTPLPALARTGNDPWMPLTGAGLLLVALMIRRRLVAAQPVRGTDPVNR